MNLTPRATLFLIFSVVAILSFVSFFDPSDIEVSWLRRADIFSQLHPTVSDDLMADELVDEESYLPVFSRTSRPQNDSLVSSDTLTTPLGNSTPDISITPIVQRELDSLAHRPQVDTVRVPDNITPLEDFSIDGMALDRFYDKLSLAPTTSRPVRIAFLGDSFIEGDLFTQDLREMIQSRFGGRGVGFAPITSAVSMFRQSVVHTFAGWQTFDVVNRSSRGNYTISSHNYIPQGDERSVVAYKGVKHRRFLDHFSVVRFFFVNPTGAKIDAVVNDTVRRTFEPEPSDKMSYVSLTLDSIRSVRFSVRASEGFTAYGVSMDGRRGVSVDNYSLRGNSGASIASVNGALTTQFDDLMPVDMIVLQYGLNMIQSGTTNYVGYMKQISGVIARLRELLPDAVIVVMGVSDCSSRASGEWATKPEAAALASAQRKMARAEGVVYWSTLGAMRKLGGMPKFVEYGWAAKDYMHLSAKGGRKVATALFDAMIFDMEHRGFLD